MFVAHQPGGFVLFRRTLALAVLPCAAAVALAQTPDSTAFRGGQWGVEMSSSGFGGFVAAGALRFTSENRAWIADGRVEAAHAETSGGGTTNTGNNYSWSLRLGRRRYTSIQEQKLYRFVTLGVQANYGWSKNSQSAGSSTEIGYGGGVFADLGATWLVTPHLGLGAKIGAALTYNHSSQPGNETKGVSVSAGTVALGGQLYF